MVQEGQIGADLQPQVREDRSERRPLQRDDPSGKLFGVGVGPTLNNPRGDQLSSRDEDHGNGPAGADRTGAPPGGPGGRLSLYSADAPVVGASAGNEQGAQQQDESAGGDGSRPTRQGLHLQIPVSYVSSSQDQSQGSESGRPHRSHKGRHNFRVDELYWFRFLQQGLMRMESFSQGR